MEEIDDCRNCEFWKPGRLSQRPEDAEGVLSGGRCLARSIAPNVPPPVNESTCELYRECSAHVKAERVAYWDEEE